MKNKLLLACGFFLLLIFLTAGTYAWYTFFLNATEDFDVNKNNSLVKGSIVFVDNGTGVYDENAESVEDIEVDTVPPYKFQVINNGNTNGDYTLYIEDLPVNSINDGCTEETLLSRSQLKYQLKLNGNVIKEDYLSNVRDNILDERDIRANKTNNYELRIYIHDEADEWTSKHYHYKIVLNKTEGENK